MKAPGRTVHKPLEAEVSVEVLPGSTLSLPFRSAFHQLLLASAKAKADPSCCPLTPQGTGYAEPSMAHGCYHSPVLTHLIKGMRPWYHQRACKPLLTTLARTLVQGLTQPQIPKLTSGPE